MTFDIRTARARIREDKPVYADTPEGRTRVTRILTRHDEPEAIRLQEPTGTYRKTTTAETTFDDGRAA